MSRKQAKPQGPVAILANTLLMAPRDALSARQRKILLWGVWWQDRTNELCPCELEVAEFARVNALGSGSVYGELRRAVEGLQSAMVYPGGRLYDRYGKRAPEGPMPWVTGVDFSRPGVLRFTLNNGLARYLTNQTANFTQVRLRPVMRLKSTYALAFWERLELHRRLRHKCWEMKLLELRQWLGVAPGQYESPAHFRKRVIDRARAELVAQTDQSFSYEMDHDGRDPVFCFMALGIPRLEPPQRADAPRPLVTLATDPLKLMKDNSLLNELTKLRLETGTPEEEVAKLVSYARRFSRRLAESKEWSDEQVRGSPEFLEWVQWLVGVDKSGWQQQGDQSPCGTPFLSWLRTGRLEWTPPWTAQ